MTDGGSGCGGLFGLLGLLGLLVVLVSAVAAFGIGAAARPQPASTGQPPRTGSRTGR